MIVILYHPQIPQNTGNIIRTCYATGTELILVSPLGFKLDDKSLKRAGLDYYEKVKITIIDDLAYYLSKNHLPVYFLSSKGKIPYTETKYERDSIFIFGSEGSGLPLIFHEKWEAHFRTIPIKKNTRCLNLSNSVAIVLYEGLRQHNFAFID